MAFRSINIAAASVPAAYAVSAVLSASRAKGIYIKNNTDVTVTLSLSGSGVGEIVLAAGGSYVDSFPVGDTETLSVFVKGTGTTGTLNIAARIEG